jgi:hypothetical protein
VDAERSLHIDGNVQGIIQGDHNTVTLVFAEGSTSTVPFLAPPLPAHRLVGRSKVLDDLCERLLGRRMSRALLKFGDGPGTSYAAVVTVTSST